MNISLWFLKLVFPLDKNENLRHQRNVTGCAFGLVYFQDVILEKSCFWILFGN